MRLTHRETDEIRQLVESREIRPLESLQVTEVDLYAAIELACCQFLKRENHKILFPCVTQWAFRVPMLQSAIETIHRGNVPLRINPFRPRPWEFFPITTASWNDNDYHLFESRFTAAVRQAGFGRKSTALAGAFFEMADNITQHSGPSSVNPARGILGYQVESEQMTFGVGDVGRGVLASLTENPAWKHIEESADALEAIVKDHASRRLGLGPGQGFLQVFKSLADMNGQLIFRSGDGLLTIAGQPDRRQASKGSAVFFPGFQLSVSCSVK